MIESIRQEFLQVLQDTDWMDKESKDLALSKVGRKLSRIFLFCIEK